MFIVLTRSPDFFIEVGALTISRYRSRRPCVEEVPSREHSRVRLGGEPNHAGIVGELNTAMCMCAPPALVFVPELLPLGIEDVVQ